MLQAVAHIRDVLDGAAQPMSTGADGRQALELVTALRASADQDGAVITLPLSEHSMTVRSR